MRCTLGRIDHPGRASRLSWEHCTIDVIAAWGLEVVLVDVDVPAVAEGRVALAASFAGAARRYWLGVFPRVCIERRRRRSRALQIPDPLLRHTAIEAQRKWGNVEGAAAFAAFVPRRHRAAAARAMACYQAAYNYLDMLGEQPSDDPVANGRSLHSALLIALEPGPQATHPDYYEHNSRHDDDGGYLAEPSTPAGRRWPRSPPIPRSRRWPSARPSVSSRFRAATPASARAISRRSSAGRGRRHRRRATCAGGRSPRRRAPRWVCTR